MQVAHQSFETRPHVGLRIMVERADAIHVTLSVHSNIDGGTQIRVVWSEQEV